MADVYKRLALVLDTIPNGYPETKSGVELKILAKLFSPEEAELACSLTLEPQGAKALAQKTGGDEREIFTLLKGMVKKRIIELERCEGYLGFKLMPFVVGFYESQNANIDREFAQLFENYYREALHKTMTMKPSVHRVIPIEKSIPLDIEVLPYERASTYIDEARSWGVLRCICRVQKQLIGQGCEHSIENCLVFSKKANAFNKRGEIRAITREEALDILAKADEEGLIHSTENSQKDVTYICNCCTCSCGVMRGVAEYNNFNSVAASDFFAAVDESLCTGCSACLERCQFNALSLENDLITVSIDRCLGCGLCVTACPTGALHLEQKPEAGREVPPETEEDWRALRARSRKAGR